MSTDFRRVRDLAVRCGCSYQQFLALYRAAEGAAAPLAGIFAWAERHFAARLAARAREDLARRPLHALARTALARQRPACARRPFGVRIHPQVEADIRARMSADRSARTRTVVGDYVETALVLTRTGRRAVADLHAWWLQTRPTDASASRQTTVHLSAQAVGTLRCMTGNAPSPAAARQLVSAATALFLAELAEDGPQLVAGRADGTP
ncbi:hypothetical protein [Kitasatospora sp. NPDC088783]|uniref:hypothetical protein n=1 Tax=Kitasatospora sp. NPDC088783 TaxID=3364077 RepID=UPI0037F4638B